MILWALSNSIFLAEKMRKEDYHQRQVEKEKSHYVED